MNGGHETGDRAQGRKEGGDERGKNVGGGLKRWGGGRKERRERKLELCILHQRQLVYIFYSFPFKRQAAQTDSYFN